MHTRGAGISLLCGVQAIQGGFNFVCGQHRQLTNRTLRVGHNRGQQVAPVPSQTLDTRGVEQVGGVCQAGHQLFTFLVGVQLQVELRGAGLPLKAFDLQSGQHRAQRAGAALLVIKHHLKQRAVAQAALALQRVHQTLERQVLIALGIQ